MKPLKEIRMDFDLYEKERSEFHKAGIRLGYLRIVKFIESGKALEDYFGVDLDSYSSETESLIFIANRLGIPLSDKEAK